MPVGANAVRSFVELLAAVGGRVQGRAAGEPTGVSIDSRTLARGDLFFALRGPNFDGHDFVGTAFERGAWGAVVETTFTPRAPVPGALVAVADTTRALQEMSRARRADLEIPFVGVTGSVGKTTTKEAIACAVSARFRVTKTEGNLNNHLGVPLSILRAPRDATAAVYELAMSAPGEIRFLAELARPVVGVVTNVAEVHLESMGSLEAIARAKVELVEALPPEGAAILNWDDPRVRAMAAATRAQVVSYGFGPEARLRAERVHLDENGTLFEIVGGGSVRIPAWGRHLVYAGLAAIASAELLGVPATEARDALRAFRPASGRSAFRPLGRARLLDDSYNASPASVRAAVAALCERPGGAARLVVLGDMLELGPRAEALHEELGAHLARQPIDRLFLFGPLGAAVERGARRAGLAAASVTRFDSHADIAAALRACLRPGDHLLVKGSRGMRMEEVIRLLEADLPQAIRPETGAA
jgi:UDP-N-acetylmuramoyl-tripeptide--D-alanyl-D-alanine ligase